MGTCGGALLPEAKPFVKPRAFTTHKPRVIVCHCIEHALAHTVKQSVIACHCIEYALVHTAKQSVARTCLISSWAGASATTGMSPPSPAKQVACKAFAPLTCPWPPARDAHTAVLSIAFTVPYPFPAVQGLTMSTCALSSPLNTRSANVVLRQDPVPQFGSMERLPMPEGVGADDVTSTR